MQNDKNKELFDRGLKNVIDSFEKAKEWADLSNCLQKAKGQIVKYQKLPIPRQKELAKRLAQCLNPEINVIHQLTLEVYKLVFERELDLLNKEQANQQFDRKSSVALFFSGLFNFYQFAAFEVKNTFLDIIKDQLLKMKKELILSLPGFMLCMLPALEDQNGQILKKVESILIETEKIVGTSEFYGEIWKAMLRTPRARLPAIRYLDKKIPKDQKHTKKNNIYIAEYTIQIINHEVILARDEQKIERITNMKDRMELHDYFFFYFPNKSKLVINALISGLSLSTVENTNYVNRATLDFLISHMPIKSTINSISENIRLVECASLTYTKKDFATLNKMQNWLFYHFDEDEREIDSQDPTIITIVESQKNLFKKSMNLNIQEQKVTGTQNVKIQPDKNINDLCQILLRIMSEEQNIIEPILEHLSIPLIKFIRFHLDNESEDNHKKFKGHLRNLLDHISPSYRAVLESLSKQLQHEIESLDFNQQSGERMQLESIDIIRFAISDLQEIQEKLLQEKESKPYLVIILSNLLKGMNKISNENKNMQLVQSSLDVIDQILNICQVLDNGATLNKQKRSENFKTAIESFNALYVSMCKKMLEDTQSLCPQDDISQLVKEELDTFNKYNNIMLKIVPYQIVDSIQKQMPEWLDMMIQCSKKQLAKMCLVTVDVFIKILDLQDDSNQVGGGTIMHIQRLIADSQGQQIFSKQQYKNNEQFKNEFLKLLQQSHVHGKHFDGNKNCKEIIQNLWSLLDYEIDTERIITHLKKFDLLVPNVFSDVVIEDLKYNKDTPLKTEKAIKKFAVFWKFTNSDYPAYKPFETEVSGKKYLALHNMINFLEDQDPTLRLSCRSWLSQSSKQYSRILDPIIEEFIKNSNFQMSNVNEEAIIIEGDFESQYVIENFGKLRNIILNTQDEIIQQMIVKNCQQHIVKFYNQNKMGESQQQKLQIENKKSSFSDPNMQRTDFGQQMAMAPLPQHNYEIISYLDILVKITLSFIRAEYSQNDQNLRMKKKNQGHMPENRQETVILTVNASACEFMELILKQVHKYSNYSNKIAHTVIKPLITTFYNVIRKENYAMQVNIINLIDIIFQECNFQGQKTDQNSIKQFTEHSISKCAEILKSEKFIDSIILGLKSDVSFVRQKFIKFVEMLVPYMRKFTSANESFKADFKSHILRLTEVFCELLKKVDVSYFSNTKVHSHLHHHTDKYQQNPGSLSNIKQGQCSSFQKKKSLEDNFETLIINQESDIIQIIGGLQCIINTCLDIKLDADSFEDENEETKEEDELNIGKLNKNDKDKKSGYWIFGGGETSYFAPDMFFDTKKALYEKLAEICVSCIHCWNHISLLTQSDYHFTRHGMFAYNQDDNYKINKKLKERKVKKEGNEAWQTFEETLQYETNAIQKKIIQLLRPIAKKIPNQFIEGIVTVWLQKKLLGQNIDINRSYEKLIQLLICVYQAREIKNQISYTMPVYQVINSLIKYIGDFNSKKGAKEPLVNLQRWTKNNPPLNVTQSISETLINSFLYAYLVYNPTMFDPLFDKRPEEKVKEYSKIYAAMLKYFNTFKLSRNPFTICWLLEMLNVLGLKIRMEDAKLDNRIRKEYHDLFNNMLTNCSSIISDTFNIQFHEDQKFNLSFPPTVYEMLWRYQYIQDKSQINEIDLLKSFDQQSPLKLPTIETGDSDRLIKSGSLFFNKQTLRSMVDQKFEYMHKSGGQNSNDQQSIFKNMEILMKDQHNLPKEYNDQQQFLETIMQALRGLTTPKDMLVQTKYFTIITIKQILNQLLFNFNLVGTDTEKTSKLIQVIFHAVIQILQNENKLQKGINQNQNKKFQLVMNEFITEFFASIVERSHQIEADLIKPYRRDIIDLFNSESFFQNSKVNLKQWQKIMKYFIDRKPDEILEEQMQKWNVIGGLFQNVNTINSQKCYAIKKIAFMIFSCENDHFNQQLDYLIKKMIEVFKQSKKADIKQRLFLFFLTRVLLIRLNFEGLQEALRKLWPHLLNELISVFEVNHDQPLEKDSTELTIEAIKLVELLSSLNIEDFQMNQWIFLIDGYGMEESNAIENGERKIKKEQKDQLKNQLNQSQKNGVENSEVFKTFIVRFIGDQQYSFYNVEKPEDGQKIETHVYEDIADRAYTTIQQTVGSSSIGGQPQQSDFMQGSQSIGGQPQQSNFMQSHQDINLQFINDNDDSTLQEHARSLQMQINKSNVVGNQFNRQEAEAKIELDFLKNDEILKQ